MSDKKKSSIDDLFSSFDVDLDALLDEGVQSIEKKSTKKPLPLESPPELESSPKKRNVLRETAQISRKFLDKDEISQLLPNDHQNKERAGDKTPHSPQPSKRTTVKIPTKKIDKEPPPPQKPVDKDKTTHFEGDSPDERKKNLSSTILYDEELAEKISQLTQNPTTPPQDKSPTTLQTESTDRPVTTDNIAAIDNIATDSKPPQPDRYAPPDSSAPPASPDTSEKRERSLSSTILYDEELAEKISQLAQAQPPTQKTLSQQTPPPLHDTTPNAQPDTESPEKKASKTAQKTDKAKDSAVPHPPDDSIEKNKNTEPPADSPLVSSTLTLSIEDIAEELPPSERPLSTQKRQPSDKAEPLSTDKDALHVSTLTLTADDITGEKPLVSPPSTDSPSPLRETKEADSTGKSEINSSTLTLSLDDIVPESEKKTGERPLTLSPHPTTEKSSPHSPTYQPKSPTYQPKGLAPSDITEKTEQPPQTVQLSPEPSSPPPAPFQTGPTQPSDRHETSEKPNSPHPTPTPNEEHLQPKPYDRHKTSEKSDTTTPLPFPDKHLQPQPSDRHETSEKSDSPHPTPIPNEEHLQPKPSDRHETSEKSEELPFSSDSTTFKKDRVEGETPPPDGSSQPPAEEPPIEREKSLSSTLLYDELDQEQLEREILKLKSKIKTEPSPQRKELQTSKEPITSVPPAASTTSTVSESPKLTNESEPNELPLSPANEEFSAKRIVTVPIEEIEREVQNLIKGGERGESGSNLQEKDQREGGPNLQKKSNFEGVQTSPPEKRTAPLPRKKKKRVADRNLSKEKNPFGLYALFIGVGLLLVGLGLLLLLK